MWNLGIQSISFKYNLLCKYRFLKLQKQPNESLNLLYNEPKLTVYLNSCFCYAHYSILWKTTLCVSVFRLFGGLILDIKRKAPFFVSDFTDAFHIQALSAILFIYLGTVTNAITFGGLLGDATDNMQVRLRAEPVEPVCGVFSIHVLNESLTAPLHGCRVCWRAFWAQRSPVGCSVCWLASLSPSSAAPVQFWCLNGCSSTSAGTARTNCFILIMLQLFG